MVAYCNRCDRYVNQYCDTCGGNTGIQFCEIYACGGKMLCPRCGGADLAIRKGMAEEDVTLPPQEDERARRIEEIRSRGNARRESAGVSRTPGGQNLCPVCDYTIDLTWKYCPECGLRFSTLESPDDRN